MPPEENQCEKIWIFFLHKHINSLQKPFIKPPEQCGAVLMMDGCTFLGFPIFHHTFTAIMKLGRARTCFNITPIVIIWNKKVIYTCKGLRVSQSWGSFHFWVNYPFKPGFLGFFFLYQRVTSNFSVSFLCVPVPKYPRLFVSKTFECSRAFGKITDCTFINIKL